MLNHPTKRSKGVLIVCCSCAIIVLFVNYKVIILGLFVAFVFLLSRRSQSERELPLNLNGQLIKSSTSKDIEETVVDCEAGCETCVFKEAHMPPPNGSLEFRRFLMKQPTYFRPDPEELADALPKKATNILLNKIRENGNQMVIGSLSIKLASSFGFCWGVERSIAIAYLALKKFSTRKIYLTNELIHNPDVNDVLSSKGIEFVRKDNKGNRDFSTIKQGDVVILPAFGAPIDEMRTLYNQGAIIVDSTCPWVTKVWNVVEKHKKQGITSIIHGSAKHEETEATKSLAVKYLIVRNEEETKELCDAIEGKIDPYIFLKERPAHSFSNNLDPMKDLRNIGIANQTTMLKSQTEVISHMLRATMERVNGSFSAMDTICDATQERQDAIQELVNYGEIDIMIIIGGFNSSNTAHLLEIALQSQNVKHAFHVDKGERIKLDNSIQHKLLDSQELTLTHDFISKGFITIGITSGASTPDEVVEDCLSRLITIKEST